MKRTVCTYYAAGFISLFSLAMTLVSAPSVKAHASPQLTNSSSSVCRTNHKFKSNGHCLTIMTSALPSGQVGTAYSATLIANGGSTPYAWRITSGTLPSGLSLNSSTGLISGNPTVGMNATPLTFLVTDSSSPSQTASVNFMITISALAPTSASTLSISTTSLTNGKIGTSYSQTLTASGGATPYTWKLASGTLPGGLALSSSTGLVSGTPTTVVNATPLAFSAIDSGSPAQTANVSLTLTITPATLAITTASLLGCQVGVPYSSSLTALGGTTPYTWTLTSGTLPGGLAFNSSTGLISGTPTTAVNTTPLTFKVTDSGSPAQTANVSLTLTIASPSLAITTSSLPGGQVGVGYSSSLMASGGTTPYTWTLASGTLPTGLTLNSSTGVISGTPGTALASTLLGLKVTDVSSPVKTASVSLTLTIAPANLTITTSSLPNGQVGTAYSQTLIASGGTTPYTWTLTSGTLPSGLTLNSSSGLITGTPTTAASSAGLTFKLTDASSPVKTASVSLTLTISPAALGITTSSLAGGQVGMAYSQTLTASGGATPYSWALTSGTLPSGLTLNSSTGLISGNPITAVNTTPLTFRVTDSGSPAQTANTSFTLTIASAKLAITTLSLPNGQVGTPYSQTLSATGGITPYSWALTSGTLTGGLTLNSSTGLISGTPRTAANMTPLIFTVSDSGSPAQTASVSVTLTMTTLTITTLSLSNGQAGMPYSQTLAVSGGTAPYKWALTSGILPTGLALNTSIGLISGTPTAPVPSAALTFKVTDSTSPAPQANTASFNLTVAGYSASLSWTASSSSSVVGYNIYRSNVSRSGYAKINSTTVSGTTYTDTTVASGQTYYYVTTAVASSGVESAYSNEAQGVVP